MNTAIATKEMEKQMKALANRRRLTIIVYLKKTREASVGNIAREIRLSIWATSKHLGVLYAAGIVEKEQRSAEVFYRLASNLHLAAKAIAGLL